MLSAKRRRRAATVPGAGAPVKGVPDPGVHSGAHSLPQRGWGGGLAGGEATTRRGGVDRHAATLLYADRNSRKSSLRRTSPRHVVARLASRLEACPPGQGETG